MLLHWLRDGRLVRSFGRYIKRGLYGPQSPNCKPGGDCLNDGADKVKGPGNEPTRFLP
jgi:hypothetical protein